MAHLREIATRLAFQSLGDAESSVKTHTFHTADDQMTAKIPTFYSADVQIDVKIPAFYSADVQITVKIHTFYTADVQSDVQNAYKLIRRPTLVPENLDFLRQN